MSRVLGWLAVTHDEGDHVHVLPICDLTRHEQDPEGDCPCEVRTVPIERPDASIAWMYVHNSLDGRELREPHPHDPTEGAPPCR